MKVVEASTTVGEIAREHQGAAVLFERLGIDYCCRGARTLSDACGERGLDGSTVAVMLDALIREGGGDTGHEVPLRSIGELCDHIVAHHHEPLRADLERLDAVVDKVARRHGRELPELLRVREVFTGMRDELLEHMDDEEERAFPACRAADEGGPVDAAALTVLEDEHRAVGDALAELRTLCLEYSVDHALCGTHRTMLRSLAELERELHQHIHEENNVLFPMVRERHREPVR